MGAGASIAHVELSKPSDASDLADGTACKAEVARLRQLLHDSSSGAAATTMQGACFCGACTVTCSGAPLYHMACHCDSCRRWTGTYAMAMVMFQPSQVAFTGEVLSHTRTTEGVRENNNSNRKSCATCGGALLWNFGDKATFVAAACLDQLDYKATLKSHICVPEAQYCFHGMGDDLTDAGLPKYILGPPEIGYAGDKFEDGAHLDIGNKEAGFLNDAAGFSETGTVLGECYCGAVHVKCKGNPMTKLICSCHDCRHWTGGFGNLGCLFPVDSVEITGETKSFCRNPDAPMPSHRTFCANCGGHVANHHPSSNLYDVCGGMLNVYPFNPDVHVNYSGRPFNYLDGLPKFQDFPKSFMGSGILLDERTGEKVGEEPDPAPAEAAASSE